jgi:hypothetical protein
VWWPVHHSILSLRWVCISPLQMSESRAPPPVEGVGHDGFRIAMAGDFAAAKGQTETQFD